MLPTPLLRGKLLVLCLALSRSVSPAISPPCGWERVCNKSNILHTLFLFKTIEYSPWLNARLFLLFGHWVNRKRNQAITENRISWFLHSITTENQANEGVHRCIGTGASSAKWKLSSSSWKPFGFPGKHYLIMISTRVTKIPPKVWICKGTQCLRLFFFYKDETKLIMASCIWLLY